MNSWQNREKQHDNRSVFRRHAITGYAGASQTSHSRNDPVALKRPDLFAPGVWPGYYDRASGVTVWDLDGNEYIDMSIGGIGANVLGYADPDVDAAVTNAISKGSSSSLNCREEVELAELMCEMHPWANKVRFARTGCEAMCVAVRIARAHTGRDKIAFCGYHGWHD